MKEENTTVLTLTAEEVCKKLGIKGKLIGFATPTRNKFKKLSEKTLVVKVRR